MVYEFQEGGRFWRGLSDYWLWDVQNRLDRLETFCDEPLVVLDHARIQKDPENLRDVRAPGGGLFWGLSVVE